MKERLPRGWHDLDEGCECAACEAGEPSSPYRKVRAANSCRGVLILVVVAAVFWGVCLAAAWWALS